MIVKAKAPASPSRVPSVCLRECNTNSADIFKVSLSFLCSFPKRDALVLTKDPNKPITSVKTAWHRTLERAEVPYFPIYQLRDAFCTRLGRVAPGAVVQKAMRHSNPETKRFYQLGMVKEIREAMGEANEKVFGGLEYHIFSTVTSEKPLAVREQGLQLVEA